MKFELSFDVSMPPCAQRNFITPGRPLTSNCTVFNYAYNKQPGVRLSGSLKQHCLSEAEPKFSFLPLKVLSFFSLVAVTLTEFPNSNTFLSVSLSDLFYN